MSEKVFVTGAGIISALGNGTDATLKALLSGHSGIGHIRHLATEHREFPVGEVKLSDAEMSRMLDAHYPVDGLRTVLLGIIAARGGGKPSGSRMPFHFPHHMTLL